MLNTALIGTFLREATARERTQRVPEPDLVMDDPEKVAAFTRAGREDGVMAPVYLFHCAQICEVIRPGDHVVDLGCGPGTQLAMVARLNPDAHFLGIDLSAEMLDRATGHVRALGLRNIEFAVGDITRLATMPTASVDAICSTVAFHQLPDVAHLGRAAAEGARILKAGGGVYIVDFARLKSQRSIDYFANQYADRQPELFTLDYLNSLKAAFTLAELRAVVQTHLNGRAQVYAMFAMHFMAAIKSPARALDSNGVRSQLRELRQALPGHHAKDLSNLVNLFRLGGLHSRLL